MNAADARSGVTTLPDASPVARPPSPAAGVSAVLARDGIANTGRVLGQDQIERSIRWFDARESEDDELVRTLQPRYDLAPDGRRRLAKIRRLFWSDPPFWADIFVRSRVVDLAVDLVGPDATLLFHTGFLKPGTIGSEAAVHQDQAFWQWNYPEAVTIWMALTPSTVSNGCLIGYPGSHHGGLIPHVLEDGTVVAPPSGLTLADLYRHNRSIPAIPPGRFAADTPMPYELAPGEAVVWHRYFAHGSRPNRSAMDRKGMAVVFADASRDDYQSPDFDCAGRKLDGVERAVSVREIRELAAAGPGGPC